MLHGDGGTRCSPVLRKKLDGEGFPEEVVNQARELGKKLVRSRKEKAVNPETEEIRKSFEERMRRLMLYRKEEWPFECEFWKELRGLEQKRVGERLQERRRTAVSPHSTLS
jgi:hypothetical protein